MRRRSMGTGLMAVLLLAAALPAQELETEGVVVVATAAELAPQAMDRAAVELAVAVPGDANELGITEAGMVESDGWRSVAPWSLLERGARSTSTRSARTFTAGISHEAYRSEAGTPNA